MNKTLYFRGVADVADDDDMLSSLCIPVNRLRHIDYSGTNVTLYFDNIRFPANPSGEIDSILLTATTVANGKVFADKIVEAISVGEDMMITVVDRAGDVFLDESLCITVSTMNIL